MLGNLRMYQLGEVRPEPLVRAFLIRPIRREWPATSAARIAARRRTEGISARQSVGFANSTPKTAAALAPLPPSLRFARVLARSRASSGKGD